MSRQSRWRSPIAWTSTISLILFICKQYFNIEIENVDTLIDMLFIALTSLGIFNNPEKKSQF